MTGTATEHHSVLYAILSRDQLLQGRTDTFPVDLREVSERSHVDAEQRKLPLHQIPGRLQQCAVPPDDEHTLHLIRHTGSIGILICSAIIPCFI